VDQACDGGAALDHSREVDRLVGVVQWWSLSAGLMSPMGVVALFILGQHPPQVSLPIDQQVIEALAPQRAHESLGLAVRARRSRRGLDDPYAAAGEYLVEHPRELAITVSDQESELIDTSPRSISRSRAC
jgi:hypothetical protein